MGSLACVASAFTDVHSDKASFLHTHEKEQNARPKYHLMPPHGASGGRPALDLATRAGRELLAPQSEALALPSSCAFAALHAASALQEELPPSAADHFALHAVHLLPCGVMHKAARDNIDAGSAFRIHCFKLHASRSTRLNARISQWALQEEGKALELGRDANARLSNWGGFQSVTNAFEEGAAHEPALAELHGIVSAAVEEVVGTESEPKPVCPGFSWVNVNRGADKNLLHIHTAGKLSAVYFVASGDYDPSSTDHLSGHLIFRGGPMEPLGAVSTYLAVPPSPGTLWLFDGAVPHCVLPSNPDIVSPRPRISVAVNLFTAAPPLQRQLQSTSSTNLNQHAHAQVPSARSMVEAAVHDMRETAREASAAAADECARQTPL